jgi:hypothetical protein
MSLPRPSLAAQRLSGLALTFLLTPGRALAGPSPADEPFIDPRLALDPRVESDPRIDRPDPPRASGEARPASPLRAPLWFSIGATYHQLSSGIPTYGAMFLLGLPLERLAAGRVHAAMAEEARRSPSSPPTQADATPSGRQKLDLTPPPPPPKLTAPLPAEPGPPLQVPVVVTPAAARAAVEAALRRARLTDPDARLDTLATRARQSAALPELRLRVLRTVDDGQTLSPTSYDPTRIVAVDAVRFWLEARATWRLDRLLFAEEEVTLERMRHERAEAQARLSKDVLKLLFEWQRAVASSENPALSPEENLTARLKAIEAEAELDLLTDGWFSRWRAKQPRPNEGPTG